MAAKVAGDCFVESTSGVPRVFEMLKRRDAASAFIASSTCARGFPTLRAVPWLYKNIVRPLLFACDAEVVHDRALRALALVGNAPPLAAFSRAWFSVKDERLGVKLFGLNFPNPIGLAAGLDKNAVALAGWEALGFGFVEIGTVTAQAQSGNPRPRLFRLVLDEAIVNRMGFPNDGADKIAERLAALRQRGGLPKIPLGINIGKSAAVALENAAADYLQSFEQLREFADFFALNVSSPNTRELRQLQDKPRLDALLSAVCETNKATTDGKPKPLLIKIAPDLELKQLDDILELALQHQLSGIIATNTTVSRPSSLALITKRWLPYVGEGGLSGAPLREISTGWVRRIHKSVGEKLPVIGVGGVFTAADAYEKIKAGASLVQLYTGLIYGGPTTVKRINRGLLKLLARDGFRSVEEAVGSESNAEQAGNQRHF
jgi:dihydroorotate dehydrogenase